MSRTLEELFDVEPTISEGDIGFERERADAVKDTLDRVGGGFVAAILSESERESRSGRECERDAERWHVVVPSVACIRQSSPSSLS